MFGSFAGGFSNDWKFSASKFPMFGSFCGGNFQCLEVFAAANFSRGGGFWVLFRAGDRWPAQGPAGVAAGGRGALGRSGAPAFSRMGGRRPRGDIQRAVTVALLEHQQY